MKSSGQTVRSRITSVALSRKLHFVSSKVTFLLQVLHFRMANISYEKKRKLKIILQLTFCNSSFLQFGEL